MTTQERANWLWILGGMVSLFCVNVAVRWQEARTASPEYVSPDTLERVLRLASRNQCCAQVED